MSALGPIPGATAPIPGVASPDGLPTGAAGTEPESGGGGFGKALADAVNGLNDQVNAASEQAQQLATGQTSDLTGVVMATEQASLELQVASAIRNKAVEAYQEIFRMQV